MLSIPGYNELLVHSQISNFREALETRLKANALEYLGTRKELYGDSYSDIGDERNFLTPQELTGENGNRSDYEARRLRDLFSENGMSLDQIMYRYHEALEAAKQAGKPIDEIPFLTEGEKGSLDFAIGMETGLSTIATRNLVSRGGAVRSFTGYIHGLPLWQLGNMMESFNSISGKTSSKHAGYVIPTVAALGALMLIAGLTRQEINSKVNKALFNQSSTLPTLENAIISGDPQLYANIGVRAITSWLPGVGDLINGVILHTPDRFGYFNSVILGWTFAKDVLTTASQMMSGHEVGNAALGFLRRWNPLAKNIINQLPSREGLNKHYNAINDIRAILPPGMEAKSRQAGQVYQDGPLSPLVRAMVNAAARGDDAGFQAAYQKAVDLETQLGKKNPELAVRESFLAHNPWLALLRTLPTDQERAQAFSRATPQQLAEIQADEAAFSKYAGQIGGTANFTLEQREANHVGGLGLGSASGGGSGSSSGTAGYRLRQLSSGLPTGIGSYSAGRSSGGGRLRRISSGVRSSSSGGSRSAGVKAPRLHRTTSHFRSARTGRLRSHHKKSSVYA